MPETETDLFPNLAPILRDWGRSGTSSLPTDEHGGVTDADVEAFVKQRLTNGGTVGPNPMNGATARLPQFSSGSTGTPPADSTVEPPAPDEPLAPEPAPEPVPAPEPDVPEPEPTDLPPEPPEPESSPPLDEVVVGDYRIPASKLAEYARFDAAMATDPRWSRFVTEYLSTGRVPTTEPAPVPALAPAAVVPPTPQPVLPPLPADYADDPVVSGLHQALSVALGQLNSRQDDLTRAVISQQQQAFANTQVQNDAMVMRALRDFQQRKSLTNEEMKRLETATADLAIVPRFMSGRHPITGTPFKPDVIAAVDASLDIVYNAIPEFRAKEQAKLTEQRRADQIKRQKLAAVAGSSGSVPRVTPLPTTPQERHAAMVAEVAAIQSGNWSESA